MAVQAIKSENKCKLCRADHRAEIDDLLEKRSLRQKNESGEPINLAYVLRALATDYGIENPNEDNIKIHWRKHCRQVSEGQAEKEQAERDELLSKIESGEIELADIDDSIRVMFTLGVEEVKARARRGERTGVTIDHLVKFGDLLTKRRHNEKTEELMQSLGGAVALAFGGGGVQGELPAAPDEIEGEVVEEGELNG